MARRETVMVRDPVCGLRLDDSGREQGGDAKPAYMRVYEGVTYYFCSAHCKRLFEEDPERHSKGSWLGGADLER
jgi:YHS domain-containing protein